MQMQMHLNTFKSVFKSMILHHWWLQMELQLFVGEADHNSIGSTKIEWPIGSFIFNYSIPFAATSSTNKNSYHWVF